MAVTTDKKKSLSRSLEAASGALPAGAFEITFCLGSLQKKFRLTDQTLCGALTLCQASIECHYTPLTTQWLSVAVFRANGCVHCLSNLPLFLLAEASSRNAYMYAVLDMIDPPLPSLLQFANISLSHHHFNMLAPLRNPPATAINPKSRPTQSHTSTPAP